VIEIGDVAIWESSAICAYLADAYSAGKMAPVLTSPDRAHYQQWMYFAAATLDPYISRIMIVEDIPAGELRTTKESALLTDFRDSMEGLDQALSHRDWLVGGQFGAADICVGYHLYFASLWPEYDAVIREFPQVAAYLARLKQLPSAIAADVFSYPT
jgi:glutathione S-transferase